VNSIKTASVCGLGRLGACIAATSQPGGGFFQRFFAEGHATGARAVRDAGKRKQLKRRGCRVLVHDFAATPANAPSLHEFRQISNWEKFEAKLGVKLAVICCPWPQCRGSVPIAGTSIFAPRRL
jgi:hypothetical protein